MASGLDPFTRTTITGDHRNEGWGLFFGEENWKTASPALVEKLGYTHVANSRLEPEHEFQSHMQDASRLPM